MKEPLIHLLIPKKHEVWCRPNKPAGALNVTHVCVKGDLRRLPYGFPESYDGKEEGVPGCLHGKENRMIKELEGLPEEYKGLYGEVVTCDTYRLKQLPFIPDLIFDVGANVGFFTQFARTLFPRALIVAVEPHPASFVFLKKRFGTDPRIVLLNKALGTGGDVYHGTTARNGSGETYLSAGLGYPQEQIHYAARKRMGLEFTRVQSVTLADLFVDHFFSDMRCVLKVDCEGAENFIWQDACSFQALCMANYIAMELHDYGLTQDAKQEVVDVTRTALERLAETHRCERQGVNFWAIKK